MARTRLGATVDSDLLEEARKTYGSTADAVRHRASAAWEAASFDKYLINSFLYTAVATAIFVVTSVFVAFPIARGYFKGGKALLGLYVVALFLPPALIPQFQLILNLGLFNSRLGYVLLFLVNPIGIIILVNYIKSLPVELDESAAMDGCGC